MRDLPGDATGRERSASPPDPEVTITSPYSDYIMLSPLRRPLAQPGVPPARGPSSAPVEARPRTSGGEVLA